jgi:hypothetical protein
MKNLWNNKIKVLWYSHPRIAIALTLVCINLAVIGVFTGILSLITGNTFFDELAYIFTFTMSSDGIYDFVNSAEDLRCFIVKMVLALIQMVIFSGALIGFTTDVLQSTIDARLNNIGKINLKDHYVFLNWSSIGPRVIYDLSYLDGHKNVIILCDKERDEVLNSIASVFTDNKQKMKNMRIFVKEGDPLSSKHLDDISLGEAKYIGVFLSDVEGEGENDMTAKDINAVKTLLTMMNLNTNANIVVEVENDVAVEKIEGLLKVSESEIDRHIIAFSHNAVVGHILGRSVINPTFDAVYNQLLSYEGVEFYGIDSEDVEDALYKYNDCIPVVNYDDDDKVDENGNMAADQLYILSDNRETLGVRPEKKSYVKELKYCENKKRDKFTVFIVSSGGEHSFVVEELNAYAQSSNDIGEYRSYSYSDLEQLKSDLLSISGKKKILLLSSSEEGAKQDADVFLAALDLKLTGTIDDSAEVYAEIVNPINMKSLQNLGVVSVIVSNRIVSLFMLQLLTHANSKKFYRDLISINDGIGNDGIDVDIMRADELLMFDSEYISFSCQSELVQSFYIASGKTKMCMGIKHGDELRFLCDGMDKPEDLRVYPEDELVLAVY